MVLGGGGAVSLFGGVVDLERQDGEAVEDETGGFGVERRLRVLGAGLVEHGVVEDFNQIIAGLVEGIDRVFDGSDVGVGDFGFAGFILLVPEIEVGAMVGQHCTEEV
jgi:hypothetical protein